MHKYIILESLSTFDSRGDYLLEDNTIKDTKFNRIIVTKKRLKEEILKGNVSNGALGKLGGIKIIEDLDKIVGLVYSQKVKNLTSFAYCSTLITYIDALEVINFNKIEKSIYLRFNRKTLKFIYSNLFNRVLENIELKNLEECLMCTLRYCFSNEYIQKVLKSLVEDKDYINNKVKLDEIYKNYFIDFKLNISDVSQQYLKKISTIFSLNNICICVSDLKFSSKHLKNEGFILKVENSKV